MVVVQFHLSLKHISLSHLSLVLSHLVAVWMAGGTVPWNTAQWMEDCHPGVCGAPARSHVGG